jgi:hypothetical protein
MPQDDSLTPKSEESWSIVIAAHSGRFDMERALPQHNSRCKQSEIHSNSSAVAVRGSLSLQRQGDITIDAIALA